MPLLGILKLRNKYISPPVGCIYSFQPFIEVWFEFLWRGNYSFCFIRIFCCLFAVRKHEVLLDYVGPLNEDPTGIALLKLDLILLII